MANRFNDRKRYEDEKRDFGDRSPLSRDMYGRRSGRGLDTGYDYKQNRYGREGSYYRERGGAYDLQDDYRQQERDVIRVRGGEDHDDWRWRENDETVPGPFSGIGPRGYQRSEENIKEEACEILTRNGQLDASDIEVEVQHGEITLRGTVDSRWAKRIAEDMVETVSGVWDVHNRLRVRKPEQFVRRDTQGKGKDQIRKEI